MKKTIYIGENNLVNLKNAMADSNVGHSNSAGISDEMLSFLLNNKPSISSRWAVVFGSFFKYFEKKSYATYYYKFLSRGNKGKVKLIDLDNFSLFEENKPPYEDDEYTIGGEGGNNDFFHINSKKQITESARADLDAIDSISFTVDEKYNFDEEEYSHWWDYYDTEEEYLKSCEYYDGEVYDTDGHLIEYFGGDRDEVEYYFADNLNIAEKIFNRDAILRGNTYWITDIQDELVNEINVDINNVDEVNKAAKKLSKPNGASLFVLIDGSIISFHDHAQIQSVCDGMTISKFLELGNIRCGGGNVVTIQLIKEPTFYQRHTLKNMLEYADEAIVDFAEPNKYDNMYPEVVHSVSYRSPNPERVVNDIVYYFVEGIMPVNESKEEGKNILTESQESKSIAAAKKLVMQRLGYNEQEADEFIRIKLRNDIPSLRTPQGGKFILGVTRMFCDGELRTANDIGNINSTLKLVASDAHINEYDRNLNGMPAQELIQRFAKAMSDNIEAEKNEIGQMEFDTPSDYEIVRIDSFEQAEEYGDYVSWCVTHDEKMFDSYTSDGFNQFYFCLKNGFENVEEAPSEGCPLDEYGLSMIAVSVNENGMLNTCTCRWNHDNGGDDSIMNAKEVSQVIGMNFFEVFKPNNKWKDLLTSVMQRIANGEDPRNVFDCVYNFREGFARVKLNNKCNFINQEGRILSNQWFDDAGSFYEGFAWVELNEKYNLINQEGRLISDQWFDDVNNFVNGFVWVVLNDKYNFIDQEGRLLSDQWFDDVYDFVNGFASVRLNGKEYKIDTGGNLSLIESMNKNKKIGGKSILTESQESKSITAAKKLVMQRLNYNEQEADEFVRIKLRNDIPSLRTPQGGKFILGVTRMFCDGELRTANDIGNLNSTLKLVASDAHINEYDRNLNGMPAQELIQRFAKAMSDNIEAEKNEIGQMTFDTTSDYEIVRIDSFEQAEEYGDYVSWCVTHDEDMFDSYTSDGINQFYFCLKNGFENVEETPSEGCPLDEYGLSMIAVSVNENGMLNTCTCRWNHDNGGDDSIMNSKEVSQVIGMNFFEVFKPNNKWKDLLTSAMQRLENGENPRNVFDNVDDFSEGFAMVVLNDKCNYINQEGRLLSDQWFDDAETFSEGFAMVALNDKWNFINQECRFLSSQWFDYVGFFSEGFAGVRLNNKWNFINQEGRFLSSQWFDGVGYFSEGFAVVVLNDKWNFINQDGRLISDQWFDYADKFREGFARVVLNDKWNFINQDGRLISDQWFDSTSDFCEGFACVRVNGNEYELDTSGNLSLIESINKNKKIVVSESQLKTIKENLDLEVDSSEVDLSSFKKKHKLAPNIWEGFDLNPRARLKLLDIADDFWDFANITWVKRKGIHLTGSICNFNWSKFSDIDLHIVVDFSEIDERKEFVQEYFDSKKNEWNNEHSNLKIYGYPVELYVEDVNAETTSNGIYDLEENDWVKKPNPDDVSSIGLNKFSIKERAAEIMTKIDDLYDEFKSTDDDAKLREIGKKAKKLLNKIKTNRKYGLNRNGESDTMNIVYKCLRRTGYIDMLWDLSSELYDKINSIDINESINLSDIDVFSLAKKHFGITRDIRECGYILPDGSMLDFSGRHYITGNTDSSHLNGRRSSDHRDIYEIGWDGNTKKFSYKMEDFIRAGAIRIHASSSYSSINLFKKPTKEQENILIRLIQYSKGNVIVEIGDGDNSYSYAEYDNVRPRRIISDIIKYFDEGINLIGNVIENRIIDIAERFIKECTINEEVVADGNSSHNPFKKRWKHEKDILKNYLVNYGEIMTSKENGKQYKVLYDQTLSSRLGINYCICIQWNQITMEPGNIMYVRAYDMFTKKLFRPQFDTRGFDNVAGTSDDTVSY